MRTIGFDHIDYWQRVGTVQKGLKSTFGIRVRDGSCTAVMKLENKEPRTFGESSPIPVDLDVVSVYIRTIVENHVLNEPNSDLMDLLTGRKSFQEALDSPQKMEMKRAAANRALRLPNVS